MTGRRKRRAAPKASSERPTSWQKVNAFANLGRLAVATAKLVHELLYGEGPGPHLW